MKSSRCARKLQEADDDAQPALRQTLNEKQLALKTLQGEMPLLFAAVEMRT